MIHDKQEFDDALAVIFQNCVDHPDAIAVADQATEITYGQLKDLVQRLAALLGDE